jgi:hypothetical protein
MPILWASQCHSALTWRKKMTDEQAFQLAALVATETAAYLAVKLAQQASIALLDRKGRKPSNKARRALYDASVAVEDDCVKAWGKADYALVQFRKTL